MKQKELPSRVKKLLSTMSPVDLASKMGVSLSTIYRMKTGTNKPQKLLVAALERVEVGEKKARVR